MTGAFRLGRRAIGGGAPCFVIAEAGVNHNGDPALAARLVDVAADAGADAVKFQTFRSEALVSRRAAKAAYQVETTGADESQLDMLRRLELPVAAHRTLLERCARRSIMFLSSSFDEGSADALEALGVAGFKIPSVEAAMAVFRRHAVPVALLHCVSAYPAPANQMNLRAIDTLRERFACPVGLSDHTVGTEIALAAVARGAEVLEKHFTVDTSLPGPDHRASLDPAALAAMLAGVRAVEAALGDGIKKPTAAELDTRDVARKSLVTARPVARGSTLGSADVTAKRPGTGIPPTSLAEVVGRRARRDLDADEVLQWTDLA